MIDSTMGKMKWSQRRCPQAASIFPPFPPRYPLVNMNRSSFPFPSSLKTAPVLVQKQPCSGRESPTNDTCTEYKSNPSSSAHLYQPHSTTYFPCTPSALRGKCMPSRSKSPLPSIAPMVINDRSVTEACPQRLVLHNGNIAWTSNQYQHSAVRD